MTKAFESDVKVGELRIFADLERPVVALIAEDRGAFGFRIIPVSDFTNVSCEGEQRFGDRVYQFWNACSVPRCFAARSWVVDTLSSADLQSLLSTSTSTSNFLHPLTSYQRAYLFSVPSPLVRLEKESSLRSSSFLIPHFSFRRVAGWALAACFVLALVFAVRLDLDRASGREEKAHAWTLVMKPSAPEALQSVAEDPAESDSAEQAVAANAPEFRIAPPDGAVAGREPEIGRRVSAPRMAKMKVAEGGESVGRYEAAVMRALGRKTTEDHAVAVLTYLACGVNAAHTEFGGKFVESTERLVREVRDGGVSDEYARRLVATALCRAYAATSNPDLKASAETALDALGDKRAVEVVARGYGLLDDWFASRQPTVTAEPDRVAAPIVVPDWFRFLRSCGE